MRFERAGIEGLLAKLPRQFTLRARNPAMGIRGLDSLEKLAQRSHLKREGRKLMPANNQMLIFRALEATTDD